MSKFASLFSHKKFMLVVLLASVATLATARIDRADLDITKLHVDELYFPANFLFGFATAHYQNDGADNCPASQWAHFEKASEIDGKVRIKNNITSGTACDHMHRYKEDIALMKNDFNANTYRFSVAWDRIEPEEGAFNEEALQHHIDVVDELKRNGIEPMITLHHFVHPQWFEAKGGFLNEENIHYFVRFSQKVFAALGSKVKLWGTFNEPNIFAFCGYLPLYCVFPPQTGSILFWGDSFRKGAHVLRNLMIAHTEAYRALKQMPNGDKAQIGLVHQYLRMEAGNSNPFSYFPGWLHNEFFETPLNFLKTGVYKFRWLGVCDEEYVAEGKLTDFIGLNFYSRPVFKGVTPTCYEGQVMTDMEFPIYPAALYEAIKDVAQLGVPIYITENGISDKEKKNDWRRVKWIREYLKMVSLAIEDGYDVRGYYYWTFSDNFEWNNGWTKKFGLYSVDINSPHKTRTLKEGGRVYADIVKATRAGKLQTPTSDRLMESATAAPAA